MVAMLGLPAAVTAGLGVAEAVLKVAAPVIDKFFPDPQKAAEVRNELMKTLVASDIAQIQVNTEEAKSSHIFVSGWRPAFGWLGVILFLYAGMITPVVEAFVGIKYPDFKMPISQFLLDNVTPLVFGMLGMGTLRSWDKLQGTDTTSVRITSASRDPQSLADRIKGGK